MIKGNVVATKSFEFAKRIYFLYKFLTEEKGEFILSKQILRSGTSIGANIEEAIGAQSKKDFLSQIAVAYKEARETHYWLRLLYISYPSLFFSPRIQAPAWIRQISQLCRIRQDEKQI